MPRGPSLLSPQLWGRRLLLVGILFLMLHAPSAAQDETNAAGDKGQDTSTNADNQGDSSGHDKEKGLRAGQARSTNKTRELVLSVSRKDHLFLKMTETGIVVINFTLYCSHPSVRYSVKVTTEDKDVAFLNKMNLFNISCADGVLGEETEKASNVPESSFSSAGGSPARSDPKDDSSGGNGILRRKKRQSSVDGGSMEGSSSLPVVKGQFNFSLHGELLGRTWLILHAEREAHPDVNMHNSLVLPWKSPVALTAHFDEDSTTTTTATNSNSDNSNAVPYHVNPESDDVTDGDDDDEEVARFVVTVIRVPGATDISFRGVLYGFIILSTIGMGCKTEPSVVRKVLRKPIAPAIGFGCQYLFMPLIAFMLAKTLTVGDPAVSLGIFCCGICPGGGPSNMFTYLLDGDVSLSVTMTALSSVGALAMIPLWLFTLGTLFQDDKISLQVPFGKIIMTLCVIIIPLFVGALIKKCLPKVANVILKILKPFTIVAVLFLVTFGIYANLYVFSLFSPRTLAAGCLLPYIGYTLGGIFSILFRQPCFRVKTIAIETGIQNTGIAYLLLVFSLPAPDGDMAAVGPMASAIMTPIPLLVLTIAYLLYKRFCKKKEEKKEVEGEEEDGAEEGDEGGREGGRKEDEIALKDKNNGKLPEGKENDKNGKALEASPERSRLIEDDSDGKTKVAVEDEVDNNNL